MALLAMTYAHPEQLVDTDWVAAHAADANVRIVDMRQSGYEAGHVPRAFYLSPIAIRDAQNPPTFLPTPAAFEALMRKLGISNATRVVVYDERGGIDAARLWWYLDYFGHSHVTLVNADWVKWAADSGRRRSRRLRRRGTARPQPWVATRCGRRDQQAGRDDRRRAAVAEIEGGTAASNAAASWPRLCPCTGKICSTRSSEHSSPPTS